MNDYFGALSADMPGAEQPNDWSKMLMSLANQNNSWSAEQAQKQMDFQREMSNTAHQREVEDLKAAGLNPILSAKLGGASTPSGASATADTSVVSSMVSLMNKMLDVQGTSAAAAYNASGGANVTYGTGSESGKAYMNDVDDSKTDVNGVNFFKSAGHMTEESKQKWINGLQALPGVNKNRASAIVNTVDNVGYKINNALAKAGNAVINSGKNVSTWFGKKK